MYISLSIYIYIYMKTKTKKIYIYVHILFGVRRTPSFIIFHIYRIVHLIS